MTAAEHRPTTDRVTLSREVAGVGRIDFEQTSSRREYWLLPEGHQRRVRLPSVTTVLGDTWAKPGLVNWAAKLGPTMYEVRDDAAARGHDVHRFIETYMRDGTLLPFGEFPDDRRPYLQAAARFLFEHEPRMVAVERLVCHPELKYAGRFDLLAVLNDSEALTLLDFKTSTSGVTYPEAHVQLAGYAVADKRCGGDPIERCLVIGLAAHGGFTLVPTAMGEASEAWLTTVAHYAAMHAFRRTLP